MVSNTTLYRLVMRPHNGGEFVMAFLAEDDHSARLYAERWLTLAYVAPRSQVKIVKADGSEIVIGTAS